MFKDVMINVVSHDIFRMEQQIINSLNEEIFPLVSPRPLLEKKRGFLFFLALVQSMEKLPPNRIEKIKSKFANLFFQLIGKYSKYSHPFVLFSNLCSEKSKSISLLYGKQQKVNRQLFHE